MARKYNKAERFVRERYKKGKDYLDILNELNVKFFGKAFTNKALPPEYHKALIDVRKDEI